jgi:hypothetical protein
VLCCACLAIGDYAEWIGLHPEPWLERALQLVVMGLTQDPVSAPAASIALKDVARECGQHLAPLAPSILETIGRALPGVAPGGGEGLRLMYAAGKLLNALPSTEEQLSHLEATLGLCVLKLRELLQQPVAEAQLDVVNQLKMITMFFTTLEGAIGNAVLEALLPIFEGVSRIVRRSPPFLIHRPVMIFEIQIQIQIMAQWITRKVIFQSNCLPRCRH